MELSSYLLDNLPVSANLSDLKFNISSDTSHSVWIRIQRFKIKESGSGYNHSGSTFFLLEPEAASTESLQRCQSRKRTRRYGVKA